MCVIFHVLDSPLHLVGYDTHGLYSEFVEDDSRQLLEQEDDSVI